MGCPLNRPMGAIRPPKRPESCTETFSGEIKVNQAFVGIRPLFLRLTGERARVYGLVLTSAGIEHQISRHGPTWSITVPPALRRPAIRAISLYLKENPSETHQDASIYGSMGVRTYSAFYVAAVLALIHLLIPPGAEQQLFVERFGADAGQITAGHIYRCVTAMLLHADINHLLGNLAGIIIFGGVTASLCGWGVGWLMILAAGFGANLITALWYGDGHLSIGASTAVFAAVGICTILSLRIRRWKRADAAGSSWRQWMPLAGGLALLGLLGTSAHADLTAHLSGFISGMILGGLAGLRPGRLPNQASFNVQLLAALSAGAVVAGAWIVGLRYNG